MDQQDLKAFLMNLIEEEWQPKPIELASRWNEGTITLQPNDDTQAKEIPLDVFWKKLMGIRDALRVLEQKINTHGSLATTDKANFQAYITKCYGSLTTFNILFKHGKDKFIGSGGKDGDKKPEMTLSEAKRRLGMNEY